MTRRRRRPSHAATTSVAAALTGPSCSPVEQQPPSAGGGSGSHGAIVDGGVLYMVNARGEASAAELATGRVLWTRGTTDGGFDWGYSVTAAPALADGRLFVPTQWDDLVALDAATGAELWRYATPGGPLNFAHYRSSQAGFVASPVVTGDRVWVGRPDGVLAALDAADGAERFTVTIGTAPQRMLELVSPVLCGSGRAADVRVIDPGVAPLMLRLTREGDRVVAIAAAPGVTIDGVPAAVDQPVVVTGKAIQVGPARLVVAPWSQALDADAARTDSLARELMRDLLGDQSPPPPELVVEGGPASASAKPAVTTIRSAPSA